MYLVVVAAVVVAPPCSTGTAVAPARTVARVVVCAQWVWVRTAAPHVLRARVCQAGMFAIRGERDVVMEEDFMKAARKIAEGKKLETKMDYSKV